MMYVNVVFLTAVASVHQEQNGQKDNFLQKFINPLLSAYQPIFQSLNCMATLGSYQRNNFIE